MKITILTICPEQFGDFQRTSLIERSIKAGLLDFEVVDIRDFAKGCFRKVDDSPYGGGAGMILRCQPVIDALESVRSQESHVIILAPAGKTYTQKDAHRFADKKHLIMICGHFEGMDARIYQYADELISIGDYIITGGELASMVISDSVMRLVKGSMKEDSITEESFENGLLEYPQYTRPSDYKGQKVPEVLLSGNHEAIRQWRMNESVRVTTEQRPDLMNRADYGDSMSQCVLQHT